MSYHPSSSNFHHLNFYTFMESQYVNIEQIDWKMFIFLWYVPNNLKVRYHRSPLAIDSYGLWISCVNFPFLVLNVSLHLPKDCLI